MAPLVRALLHQPDDLPQLRQSSSEGAARRDAAHRAPRRDAADRDPGHDLALAPRHRPPPAGAPVAPLGVSLGRSLVSLAMHQC